MSSLADFANKLDNLVDKREVMQRAVLIVEAQAKREAPVRTGNLRRTITSRVERGGDRGVIGTNAKYARAVHEGTKARTIRPTTKKALAFTVGGKKIVRKSVRHPGSKANRFFARAMDKTRTRVEEELGSLVEKAWARLI